MAKATTPETPQAAAVPLSALQPAPWNPRSISDERFQNLCHSVETDPEFLWLHPILATKDGTIFAGNVRYRAAEHRAGSDTYALQFMPGREPGLCIPKRLSGEPHGVEPILPLG